MTRRKMYLLVKLSKDSDLAENFHIINAALHELLWREHPPKIKYY